MPDSMCRVLITILHRATDDRPVALFCRLRLTMHISIYHSTSEGPRLSAAHGDRAPSVDSEADSAHQYRTITPALLQRESGAECEYVP